MFPVGDRNITLKFNTDKDINNLNIFSTFSTYP